MIRFVIIGDQINEDTNEFAFFDTTTGKFLEFNGEQVWADEKDFKIDCAPEYLERCLSLIPNDH